MGMLIRIAAAVAPALLLPRATASAASTTASSSLAPKLMTMATRRKTPASSWNRG